MKVHRNTCWIIWSKWTWTDWLSSLSFEYQPEGQKTGQP